jgi:hypothetical protein
LESGAVLCERSVPVYWINSATSGAEKSAASTKMVAMPSVIEASFFIVSVLFFRVRQPRGPIILVMWSFGRRPRGKVLHGVDTV